MFLALAATWLLAPTLLLAEWGVEFNHEVGLLGRRAAALYAGVGVTERGSVASALGFGKGIGRFLPHACCIGAV